MSKHTTAVIMPSPARLGPWGDDRWRFAGAIQYVSKGPDFLWAKGSDLDGDERGAESRFGSMTVRDNPADKAADIAVMVFAVLQVEEWRQLHPWWENADDRSSVRPVLDDLVDRYRGHFKLAVVQADEGLEDAVLKELATLGFDVRTFKECEH